jgi:hypothetical protein
VKNEEKDIADFLDSLVTPLLLSLGEVIDCIEYGQLAMSIADKDKGLCISVDKEGLLFGFDSVKFNALAEHESVDVFYDFMLRKRKGGRERRYFLFKNAEHYFCQDDKDAQEIQGENV